MCCSKKRKNVLIERQSFLTSTKSQLSTLEIFWVFYLYTSLQKMLTSIITTTRNCLICDAFSATFLENITNVHCSPEHCDNLLNPRLYDVFLFFDTDVDWSPKHCDDLFNLSRFYNVFLFFVTDVHRWILNLKPSRRFVKFVAIRPTTPRRLSRFVVFNK
jgi:hypothetical protein